MVKLLFLSSNNKSIQNFNPKKLGNKYNYISWIGCSDVVYKANEILKKRSQSKIIDLSKKIISVMKLILQKQYEQQNSPREAQNEYAEALFKRDELHSLKMEYYDHALNADDSILIEENYTFPEIFACFALIKVDAALGIIIKLEKLAQADNFNIQEEQDSIKISAILHLVREATQSVCFAEQIINIADSQVPYEKTLLLYEKERKKLKNICQQKTDDFYKQNSQHANKVRNSHHEKVKAKAIGWYEEMTPNGGCGKPYPCACYLLPKIQKYDLEESQKCGCKTTLVSVKKECDIGTLAGLSSVNRWFREYKQTIVSHS